MAVKQNCLRWSSLNRTMTLLFSISIMELAFDALTRLLLFLNLSIGKFAKSFSPAPFLFSFIVSYYHFWTWTSIPCSVSLHTLHIINIYVFKKMSHVPITVMQYRKNMNSINLVLHLGLLNKQPAKHLAEKVMLITSVIHHTGWMQTLY